VEDSDLEDREEMTTTDRRRRLGRAYCWQRKASAGPGHEQVGSVVPFHDDDASVGRFAAEATDWERCVDVADEHQFRLGADGIWVRRGAEKGQRSGVAMSRFEGGG